MSRLAIGALACAAAFSSLACGSGTTPEATPSAATATSPAGAGETAAASSRAAAISSLVLDAADYPPTFVVIRQQTRLVASEDVPGLPSEASGFFATSGTPEGDEFVNLLAVATSSKADAAASLQAFTPEAYLPGLTGGDPDATSAPASLDGGPPGAVAFSYRGTVSERRQSVTHTVEGIAVAFVVRDDVFIVVVSASYDGIARTADAAHIAAAIHGRLAPDGG